MQDGVAPGRPADPGTPGQTGRRAGLEVPEAQRRLGPGVETQRRDLAFEGRPQQRLVEGHVGRAGAVGSRQQSAGRHVSHSRLAASRRRVEKDHRPAERASVPLQVDWQAHERERRRHRERLLRKSQFLHDPHAGFEQNGVRPRVDRVADSPDRVVIDPDSADLLRNQPRGRVRIEVRRPIKPFVRLRPLVAPAGRQQDDLVRDVAGRFVCSISTVIGRMGRCRAGRRSGPGRRSARAGCRPGWPRRRSCAAGRPRATRCGSTASALRPASRGLDGRGGAPTRTGGWTGQLGLPSYTGWDRSIKRMAGSAGSVLTPSL